MPRGARTAPTPEKTTSRHPRMRTRSRSEAAAVERLRAICLALPGVTEKISWGELTWRAGKIFAQMDTHHHGADHVAVWLPARPERGPGRLRGARPLDRGGDRGRVVDRDLGDDAAARGIVDGESRPRVLGLARTDRHRRPSGNARRRHGHPRSGLPSAPSRSARRRGGATAR